MTETAAPVVEAVASKGKSIVDPKYRNKYKGAASKDWLATFLDTADLEAQEGNHGFAGRARMTIGNVLRRIAKERHGIFNAGGTFQSAPADFLTKVGAGEKPTHNRDGSKIAIAVAAKPAEDAKTAETPTPAPEAKKTGKKG